MLVKARSIRWRTFCPTVPTAIHIAAGCLSALMLSITMTVIASTHLTTCFSGKAGVVVGAVTDFRFYGRGCRGLKPGTTIGEDAQRCLQPYWGVSGRSTKCRREGGR